MPPVPASLTTKVNRQDLAFAYASHMPGGFVAHLAAPDLLVNKEAGDFGTISRSEFLRRVHTKAAVGAPSASFDMVIDSDEFSLVEYRAKTLVLQKRVEMYGDWIDAEEAGARRCAQVVLIDRELDTMNMLFNTTTFNSTGVNTHTGTNWTSVANGAPLTDLDLAKEAIETQCGMPANMFIANSKTMRDAAATSQIRTRMNSNQLGADNFYTLKAEQWADLLDIEHVLIGTARYNSAGEGLAVTTAKIIPDGFAFVGRVATEQDAETPQTARTFRKRVGGEPLIESWDNDDPDGRWIRSTDNMMPKLLGKTEVVGYLIRGLAG